MAKDHEFSYLYLMQVADLFKVGKTGDLPKRIAQYRSGYPRARCLLSRKVLKEDVKEAEAALVQAGIDAGLPKLYGRREWFEEPFTREAFIRTLDPYVTRMIEAVSDGSRDTLITEQGLTLAAFGFLRDIRQLNNGDGWGNRDKMNYISLVFNSVEAIVDLFDSRLALMPKWLRKDLEEPILDLRHLFLYLRKGCNTLYMSVLSVFYRFWRRKERDIAAHHAIEQFADLLEEDDLIGKLEASYELVSEHEPEMLPLEDLRAGSFYPYQSIDDVMESMSNSYRAAARKRKISVDLWCYQSDLEGLTHQHLLGDWLRRPNLNLRETKFALFVISMILEAVFMTDAGTYTDVFNRSINEKNIECCCGSGKPAKKCCMRRYGKRPVLKLEAALIAHELGYSFAGPDDKPDVIARIVQRADTSLQLANAKDPVFREFGVPPLSMFANGV